MFFFFKTKNMSCSPHTVKPGHSLLLQLRFYPNFCYRKWICQGMKWEDVALKWVLHVNPIFRYWQNKRPLVCFHCQRCHGERRHSVSNHCEEAVESTGSRHPEPPALCLPGRLGRSLPTAAGEHEFMRKHRQHTGFFHFLNNNLVFMNGVFFSLKSFQTRTREEGPSTMKPSCHPWRSHRWVKKASFLQFYTFSCLLVTKTSTCCCSAPFCQISNDSGVGCVRVMHSWRSVYPDHGRRDRDGAPDRYHIPRRASARQGRHRGGGDTRGSGRGTAPRWVGSLMRGWSLQLTSDISLMF